MIHLTRLAQDDAHNAPSTHRPRLAEKDAGAPHPRSPEGWCLSLRVLRWDRGAGDFTEQAPYGGGRTASKATGDGGPDVYDEGAGMIKVQSGLWHVVHDMTARPSR